MRNSQPRQPQPWRPLGNVQTRRDVVLLDTTKNGGEITVVLVCGKLVYAENHYDEETVNCTFDTGFVAAALAESLGVTVREVLVPPDAAKLSFEDLVKWFNGRK